MSLIGSIAPDFSLPRDGGDNISLSSIRPSNVVLYFYPRDDTSGCTKEALDFTAALDEFSGANTVIIGISKDTAAKHDKFKAKHDIGVILASDAENNVCEAYGTWVEKSMYGKKYMGIERSTFLIDSEGIVREEWRKVKVPGHVEAVLAAAKSL